MYLLAVEFLPFFNNPRFVSAVAFSVRLRSIRDRQPSSWVQTALKIEKARLMLCGPSILAMFGNTSKNSLWVCVRVDVVGLSKVPRTALASESTGNSFFPAFQRWMEFKGVAWPVVGPMVSFYIHRHWSRISCLFNMTELDILVWGHKRAGERSLKDSRMVTLKKLVHDTLILLQ